jgi:hypothetical protein
MKIQNFKFQKISKKQKNQKKYCSTQKNENFKKILQHSKILKK